jgi:hypothetical protein
MGKGTNLLYRMNIHVHRAPIFFHRLIDKSTTLFFSQNHYPIITMTVKEPRTLKPKKKLTCQRCKRVIPSNSNYCPYCALPIVNMAVDIPQTKVRMTEAIPVMKVPRDLIDSEIGQCPALGRFYAAAERLGKIVIVDEKEK